MRYLFLIGCLLCGCLEAMDAQEYVFVVYELAQSKDLTLNSCKQLKASKIAQGQIICFKIKGEGTFLSIHAFLDGLWERGFILGKRLNLAIKKDHLVSFSAELLLCANHDRSLYGSIDRTN